MTLARSPQDVAFEYINMSIPWLVDNSGQSPSELIEKIIQSQKFLALYGAYDLTAIDLSMLRKIGSFEERIYASRQMTVAGIEKEFAYKGFTGNESSFYYYLLDLCKTKVPEISRLQKNSFREKEGYDYAEIRTTKQGGFLKALLAAKLLELAVRLTARNYEYLESDAKFIRVSSHLHYSLRQEGRESEGDISGEYNDAILKLSLLLLPMLCSPQEGNLQIAGRFTCSRPEAVRIVREPLEDHYLRDNENWSPPYGGQQKVGQCFIRECYEVVFDRETFRASYIDYNHEFRKGPKGNTHLKAGIGYDPEIAQTLVVAAGIANKDVVAVAEIPKFLSELKSIYDMNEEGQYCIRRDTQSQRIQAMRSSPLLGEVMDKAFIMRMTNIIDMLHNRGRNGVFI